MSQGSHASDRRASMLGKRGSGRRGPAPLRNAVVHAVTTYTQGLFALNPAYTYSLSNDSSCSLMLYVYSRWCRFFLDKPIMFRFKVSGVNHYITGRHRPRRRTGRLRFVINRYSKHRLSRGGLTMIRVDRYMAAVLAANVVATGMLF